MSCGRLMRITPYGLLGLLMGASCALASGSDARALMTQIPGTSTRVVVAEGEGEPRSVGSYSLRVYAVADPRLPYDRFIAGVVRPRDGTIERVLSADLGDDGSTEIIVVIRSVGTGSYLSADAFRFDAQGLAHVASVAGLPKDSDPVRVLEGPYSEAVGSRATPAVDALPR
jgi:hypothetical protein